MMVKWTWKVMKECLRRPNGHIEGCCTSRYLFFFSVTTNSENGTCPSDSLLVDDKTKLSK